MFKLPKNRLWVGKNSHGTPLSFTAETTLRMLRIDLFKAANHFSAVGGSRERCPDPQPVPLLHR